MTGGELFFLIVLALLFCGPSSGGGSGVGVNERPTVPRPEHPPKGQGLR